MKCPAWLNIWVWVLHRPFNMDGCAEQTGHVYGCMFWITELFYTVGVKLDSKQHNYQTFLNVSLMADVVILLFAQRFVNRCGWFYVSWHILHAPSQTFLNQVTKWVMRGPIQLSQISIALRLYDLKNFHMSIWISFAMLLPIELIFCSLLDKKNLAIGLQVHRTYDVTMEPNWIETHERIGVSFSFSIIKIIIYRKWFVLCKYNILVCLFSLESGLACILYTTSSMNLMCWWRQRTESDSKGRCESSFASTTYCAAD